MAQKDTEFGTIDASKLCWFSWWYHSNWSSIKFGLKKRLVTRFCYKPPRTQLVCQSVKRSSIFLFFLGGQGQFKVLPEKLPFHLYLLKGGKIQIFLKVKAWVEKMFTITHLTRILMRSNRGKTLDVWYDFRIDLWEESENQRWRFRRSFHEPVVYFIHLLPHMFYMSIEVFFFPTSHSGSCVGGIVSMLDDSSHISHVIICVRISGIFL